MSGALELDRTRDHNPLCAAAAWRGDRAKAVTSTIHKRMGITYCPELATVQVFERLTQQRARTTLGAHLNHAAVFASRGHHLLAFPEVV